MTSFLSYWFYPNPGSSHYGSPKVVALLIACVLLILCSFVCGVWRRSLGNPVTRKLSRSWPRALRWFGIVGLVLVISRVEEIQFLAMRVLWMLWGLAFIFFLLFQLWRFRIRHYTIVPKDTREDPREKYLPRKG